MSVLIFHRERLDRLIGTVFGPATSHTVTIYRAGAQVNGIQTGTSILVHRGHGFKTTSGGSLAIARFTGGAWSFVALSLRAVSSSDGTHVNVGTSLTVLDGDYLLNLGADTGSAGTPLWDGSPVKIYPNEGAAGAQVSQSRLTPNTQGEYSFWTKERGFWQVVRSSATAISELRLNTMPAAQSGATVDVRDYGAVGDGVTDDTGAIQAAIWALQDTVGGGTGGNGGIVHFPAGVHLITAPLICGSGVGLHGEGALATSIKASASFAGSQMILFQKLPALFANAGISMRDIRVEVNNVDTTAIRVYKGYDAVVFDNVYVDHIGLTGRGFSFEPDPNDLTYPPSGISQTILLSNCYAIHGPTGSTGEVYYFKHCQEISLVNCKGFGGYSVGTGNCDVWHFDGCRGVTVVGGAVAITQANGIRIKSTERTSQNLAFYGVTIEAVGNAMLAQGNVFVVNWVTIHGCRKQEGAVSPPVTTGGFVFENVSLATIQASPAFTLDTNGTCNRINFYTELFSNYLGDLAVPANEGSGTKVYADNSSAFGNSPTVFRQSLALFPNDATGASVYFGHAAFADYYRLFWSRSLANDFGFNLRFTNAAAAVFRLLGIDAQSLGSDWHFFHNDVEQMTLKSFGLLMLGQLVRSTAAAVTASTTHTQVGATALTKDVNNISVCANVDDAVKLPTAVAGLSIVIMNNGAQQAKIWPASGDNLGAGVDTARVAALAVGANIRFTAYDATNWEEI